MTEEEKKLCPYTLESPSPRNCFGDRCMAWDYDTENGYRGYCKRIGGAE